MPRSLPFHLPSIRKTVRLTHCTSHSVRRRRAFEAGGATADAITSNLVQTLRANHARVLDFFRQADTNFDGVISKGEMTYALHTLGLNASPKELESLFLELDPSGDGVLEFAELQEALRTGGVGRGKKPKPKKLTAVQKERLAMENKAAKYELTEMIYAFERQRGLDDPSTKAPPSAAEQLAADRVALIQEQTLKARESGAKGFKPPRGPISRQDAIWVKSPLLRPSTAPARASMAATAEKRRQEVYDYWLMKHRDEIQMHQVRVLLRFAPLALKPTTSHLVSACVHQMAVELEYAEDKRIRKERVQNRRDGLRETLHGKQRQSLSGALERGEPFPMRRELAQHRTSFLDRQRTRAWQQDIIFLPPAVQKREQKLQRERAAADYWDGVNEVYSLQ